VLHDISPGARLLIGLQMLGLLDASDDEALEMQPVIDMLAAQITVGARLVWTRQVEPVLDLARATSELRNNFVQTALQLRQILDITQTAPPAFVEAIVVASAFGASAGWAYANAHMNDVVSKIADLLERRPTEHEAVLGISALGIGIAYHHFMEHDDVLTRCANELFGGRGRHQEPDDAA
jgi:hypothetical protein